jgi:endonuclease YncB( thermonuclease family)
LIGTLLVCATLLAVDGDTIKCNGVNMRDMGDGRPFVSGYDTPEIFSPKCQEELELGRAAKARMSELLATPGVQVWDSGHRDKSRSKRPLVWVMLPNGQTIGSVLMGEGLPANGRPSRRRTGAEAV